jgi:hypothetical protein
MDFLLYWATWAQIVFVLAVFSSLSVLGLYLVRIAVPLEHLKQNHEVAGFTFGVLGAFYGLLLAFVIVAAWQRFDRAEAAVQGEGVALTSLYQLSKGFTQPAATEMQNAIRAYTHKLIDKDWPDMQNRRYRKIDDSMGPLILWQVVTNYKPKGEPRQELLVDKSFDQLGELSPIGCKSTASSGPRPAAVLYFSRHFAVLPKARQATRLGGRPRVPVYHP